MSKRVPVLVAVALASLLSSAAFAENPNVRPSHEAFLQSLQLPAGASVAFELPLDRDLFGRTLAVKSCVSQCMSCGVNKVKLCTNCNGVVTCGSCHSGTTCST